MNYRLARRGTRGHVRCSRLQLFWAGFRVASESPPSRCTRGGDLLKGVCQLMKHSGRQESLDTACQAQGGSVKTPVWLSLGAAQTAAQVPTLRPGPQKPGHRVSREPDVSSSRAHGRAGRGLSPGAPAGVRLAQGRPTVPQVFPQVYAGSYATVTPPPPPAS